jgi:putative transposase
LKVYETNMQDNKAILEPENTYHIYNRANGNEKLFLSDDNYRYFIKKYEEYISPIAETFCYCLMTNHFHFLVRIRQESVLNEFFKEKLKRSNTDLQGFKNLEGLISRQFSNFFNAYSKAFNKQHNRKGSLFMHTFKRKLITDDSYLRKLIHYIHFNPTEAGLVKSPEEWKYSSYSVIISLSETTLLRDEVISYFEDIENFKYCHTYSSNLTLTK